jgi:hypothetical protein
MVLQALRLSTAQTEYAEYAYAMALCARCLLVTDWLWLGNRA